MKQELFDLSTLQVAISNTKYFDSPMVATPEFKLWVQDEGYRLQDKLFGFTSQDKIAESMQEEMFDLVLRIALTFGFTVGYEYATIEGSTDNNATKAN